MWYEYLDDEGYSIPHLYYSDYFSDWDSVKDQLCFLPIKIDREPSYVCVYERHLKVYVVIFCPALGWIVFDNGWEDYGFVPNYDLNYKQHMPEWVQKWMSSCRE